MAKNTNNRIPVKWVRDKAKAAYEKKDSCYICESSQDLELHHLHSMTLLLNDWARKNNHDISTDEGILAVRDQFIQEHYTEIYEMVYTLCNRHHVALHGVYGKTPQKGSEPKQARWISKQREKYQNPTTEKISETPSYGSFFSGLY